MKYVKICDIGKTRSTNQDAVFAAVREDYGLFAVADGMGGHSHGEFASQHIVEVLAKWWEAFDASVFDNDFQQMIRGIRGALERANNDIYRWYNQKDVCGSTVVVLFTGQNAYGIFSAGDSRVYLQYQHLFTQMTLDEVWENQGNLSVRERRADWEGYHGQLLNAVGTDKTLHCTVCTDALKKGMVFLLCSDGLYKFCPETGLKKYLKKAEEQESLERCSQAIFDLAYRTKANDNISFVLVRI